MSDATDAVAEAKMRTKRLAARHLVRYEELDKQLAKLKQDREVAEADPALAQDVDTRMTQVTTEMLAAKHDYEAAMLELTNLDRLGGQALSLEARSIAASIQGDPVIRTPEQMALDNVRERAKDLDAHAKLDDELAGRPAAPPPAAKPTREEADEAARAQFEALRAKPRTPASEEKPGENGEPPAGPVKKTL